MNYEIEVGFDDDTSDVVKSRTYYKVLDRYDALGIGHGKNPNIEYVYIVKKPLKSWRID